MVMRITCAQQVTKNYQYTISKLLSKEIDFVKSRYAYFAIGHINSQINIAERAAANFSDETVFSIHKKFGSRSSR